MNTPWAGVANWITSAWSGRPEEDTTRRVLWISGALGLFFGLTVNPVWQDAVEPAQVLAGVVSYPADNPVYLYSTRTWTLLHQIPALFLWLGASERTLSLLLCGVIGLCSFQAIAMVVSALGGRMSLAVLTPLFVYIVGPRAEGVGYPIYYLSSPFTYGVIGQALSVLVIALFAAGRDRAAAALITVLPAIHPTIGVWTMAIVAVGMGTAPMVWWNRLREVRGALAMGASITAVSLVTHFVGFAPSRPAGADSQAFLEAMFTYWDVHRQPIDWSADTVAVSYILLLLALVWSTVMRRRAPTGARFFLNACVAAFAIGASCAFVAERWPAWTPDLLRAAMPSRLLNVPLFAGVATLVGLAAGQRRSIYCQAVLALLVLAFLLPALGIPLNVSGNIHSWMRGATIALVLWALIGSRFQPIPGAEPARAWIPTLLQAVVVVFLAAAHVKAGVPAARYFERTRRAVFVDAASHSVLSAAARRDGLLLTASDLHRIQILTRRPVLLDGGAIDALAYVPESGPALERIAVDVYGISLLSPPFGADRPTGGFPPETGRQLWETRTVEAWQEIREKYGVTDVLTYGDWRLQLPRVSTRPDMILWSIPPRAALRR